MTEEEFYQNAAIEAMQGLMEIGGKLGLVIDAFPDFLAKHSFDIADKMLEEYKKKERKKTSEKFKTIDTIVIDDPEEEWGPGASEIIQIKAREFNVGDKVKVEYRITKQ